MLRYASQGGGEPFQICEREALQDKCPKLLNFPTPKLLKFKIFLEGSVCASRALEVKLEKVCTAREAQLAWENRGS